MVQLHLQPDGTAVDLTAEETMLDASLRAGVPHTHVCGGRARCSTCRVLVLEGLDCCPPRNEREAAIAEQLNFGPEVRLACQTSPTCDVAVRRLVLDPIDTELADHMSSSSPPEAVGQEREVAVLFADLREFTSFSEALLPYDVIHLLNRFLHEMGPIVRQHEGRIASLTGDGFMAVFGWADSAKASDQAVSAALAMQAKLGGLNPYVTSLFNHELRMGIGIHYGPAIVGALGAGEERTMTAIGDTVNTASRIEQATKELDAAILISAPTWRRLALGVATQRHADVRLAGKGKGHTLYEVVPHSDADGENG
ncbi:MAG: adenylate/guanylate cyclase domain-containing protein [Candidatus Bipolaricaulia bacterium]